jgi:hypothetical protein
LDIDSFHDMLEEISKEIPDELFKELNGGILLLPESKLHPESETPSLYTMGEYRTQIPGLGRYIVIYYGSFMKAFGEWVNPSMLRSELRKTLLHEFRHHVETLAGVKDLIIEDEIALEKYRVNLDIDKS